MQSRKQELKVIHVQMVWNLNSHQQACNCEPCIHSKKREEEASNGWDRDGEVVDEDGDIISGSVGWIWRVVMSGERGGERGERKKM